MSVADKVIENLIAFQPIDHPQLTQQERANLFYFLTCAEINLLKRKSEVDISKEEPTIRQINLKKVKILENDEGGDGFKSFKLIPAKQSSNAIQLDQQMQKEEQVHFHSLDEITKTIELDYLIKSKQPLAAIDDITGKDQGIILSLNELIQSKQVSVKNFIRLVQQILLGECIFKLRNRYQYLLNSLCKLVKQLVFIQHNQQEVNDEEVAQEVCEMIVSLPQYGEGVFDMLYELCDWSIKKEKGNLFDCYFKEFKKIYRGLCTVSKDTAMQQSALRQLVRINHSQVLDYLKSAEYQGFVLDQQNRWNILQEEALQKIEQLREIQNTECALIYIFYMGTKQIQIQKHAKILTSLIMGCSRYPGLEVDISSKLMKIKRAMDNEIKEGKTNMKIVMKTLSKSITDWSRVQSKIVGTFVDFTLSSKMTMEELPQMGKMWSWYVESVVSQNLDLDSVFTRLMESTFGKPDVELCNVIVDGMSLDVVHNAMLNQRILYLSRTFQQLLAFDQKRDITVNLLLRFTRENIQALRDNKNQLLQIFLDLLQFAEHMKKVLDELLKESKPSGLIMVLILKCISSNSNVYLEEYIVKIIQRPQWREHNAIKQGLTKYLTEYPTACEKISSQLDQTSRQYMNEMVRRK